MASGRLKLPLRVMVMVTVSCGFALAACSSKDTTRDHVQIDRSALRPPQNNPQLINGQVVDNPDARTPEGNTGLGTGSAYTLKQQPLDPVEQEIAAYEAEKRQQQVAAGGNAGEQGAFRWPWEEEKAPSLSNAPRKVPALNHEGVSTGAALAPATYDAALAGEVIVSEVDSFVPAEFGSAAPSAAGGYPSLTTVPQRPDRLQAVSERADKFAELDAEQQASLAAAQQLESQIAYDGTQGLAPQPQLAQSGGVAAPAQADPRSLAHLVNTNGIRNPKYAGPATTSDAAAAVVAGAAAYQPEGGPAVGAAPVQQVESAPVVLGSPPAPLAVPQTEVAAAAVPSYDGAPVYENEWVDLSGGTQGAVPVEEVDVAQVPVIGNVPISPEAVAFSAGGGYSARGANRLLPESRYEGRRQALYAQQQSRRNATLPAGQQSVY